MYNNIIIGANIFLNLNKIIWILIIDTKASDPINNVFK